MSRDSTPHWRLGLVDQQSHPSQSIIIGQIKKLTNSINFFKR